VFRDEATLEVVDAVTNVELVIPDRTETSSVSIGRPKGDLVLFESVSMGKGDSFRLRASSVSI
jgi:hypothetical protein